MGLCSPQVVLKGPQLITRRGVEVVVVIAYEQFKMMNVSEQKLSDFFRSSPLVGEDLDLTRDKRAIRPSPIAIHREALRDRRCFLRPPAGAEPESSQSVVLRIQEKSRCENWRSFNSEQVILWMKFRSDRGKSYGNVTN